MVDAPSHQQAVDQLAAYVFSRWPAATRLDDLSVARRFGRDASGAFLIPGALTEEPRDVIAVLDKSYPWSLPRIYLKDAPGAITVPHVEASGHLCLHRQDVVFDVPADHAHLEESLRHADDLLRAGRTSANTDDFLDEAQSYWSIVQPSSTQLLLIEQWRGTGIWHAGRAGDDFVVAPTKDRLQKWFDGLGLALNYIEPALCVELRGPLLPNQYPLTLAELFAAIDSAGAASALDRALSTWAQQGPLPVVLSFQHGGRTIVLGGLVPRPASLQMPGTRKTGLPGFRHGTGSPLAKRTALSRYPNRFDHLQVTPISRDDLLTRTAGAVRSSVREARVAVLGCGALGGPLALMLLQAGVGGMVLVDHDRFDWRNIGRHVLDGSYVGRNKASGLARAALRRFPNADVSAHESTWQRLYETNRLALEGCDLLISCTAHAASNLQLDQLISQGNVAGTVFAWVEPLAFASHAIWRSTDGEGLTSVLHRDGTMRSPVVDLASAPALAVEPACGALYQPFSSLNAMQAVTLTAELVLDVLEGRVTRSLQRSWIGSPNMLHNSGLALAADWGERIHEYGFGRQYETPLIRH